MTMRPWFDLLSLTLGSEGYAVVAVPDSHQAVARVLATRPSVALINLLMPWIDGWAVARQLKELPEIARIPLVGMTADVRSIERARSLPQGSLFARLVAKPFDLEELIDIVKEPGADVGSAECTGQ